MAVSTIMDMNLEENLKTPFSIIWDQVSYLLKHRTQAQDYFKKRRSRTIGCTAAPSFQFLISEGSS